MFFLGLAVALAFGQNMLDAATVPRWAVLAVGIPLVFIFQNIKPRKEVLILAFGTVGAAGITLFWSPDKLAAADELVHWFILATVFCLGATLADLSPLWKGIAVGVGFSGLLAIAQRMGYDGVGQIVPPAGLFMNKNMLAEAGAVAVIIAVAFRMLWLLPAVLIAWLLPLSFAAFGGVLCAAGLFFYRKGQEWLGTSIIIALSLGVVCAFAFPLPSADIRLNIWESVLIQWVAFGHGVGSFPVLYPGLEFAHSELIQFVFELGLFTLPFLLILYFALGETREPERSILIAICANGFFSFPMHLPFTAFAAALAAGHLVAGRYLVCDVHAGRSALLVHFGGWLRPAIGRPVPIDRWRGENFPAVFTSARKPNGDPRHDAFRERPV